MLQQLFGTELSSTMRLAIAIVVIAVLLGITIAIIRRMGAGSRERVARSGGRPGPRLALVDAIAVDQRRRLVLVRRDATEHLLLIGGTSDVVVESQIPVDESEIEPGARDAIAARAPRRAVAAAPAPEAIAAPEAAARIAPGITSATAALAAPDDAAEAERVPPRRRPAPRGDGTLSGQSRLGEPAAEPVIAAPAPAAPAPATALPPITPPPARGPVIGAPVIGTPREREPLYVAPASPAAATTVVAGETRTRIGAGFGLASRSEPPKVAPARPESTPEVKAEADTAEGKLDEMARRLDAALADTPEAPASSAPAPQLSLSDLIGDLPEPEKMAEDALAEPAAEPAVARTITERPALRPTLDRPAPIMPERPLGRPVRSLRPPPPLRQAPEPRAPRIDTPPRIDLPPRGERAALPGLAPRPEGVGRTEPALKLREFSLRSSDIIARAAPAAAAAAEAIPAGTHEEKPAAPEPAIRPFTFTERKPVADAAEPDVKTELPIITTEAAAEAVTELKVDERPELVAETVSLSAAEVKVEEPATAGEETKAEEEFPLALDDFDAEMANLLGRTSARR